MPRTAAFTSGVLQELLRQLEYAPHSTHLRQMDAAEHLLDDLLPQRLYPEDFITFRITGYRSDRPGTRTSVVGEALQRDLVTFIQSLSWELNLPRDRSRGAAVEMDELARRLGVSRRTLQRCRNNGLVLHYIRQDDGQRRLACYPDALERFLAHSAGRLSSAASFSRIPPEQRSGIVERARVLATEESVSMNEAARRIALEMGRSHEAIRGVLRNHDRGSGDPLFSERGPLTRRDARMIERARGRGVAMARLAERFDKSIPALHRALLRYRRQRLSSLPLVWRTDRDGVRSTVLPESIRTGLPHHADIDEVALLKQGAEAAPDLARLKIDRRAWAELCSDAAKGLAVSADDPTSEQLDTVETLLRHAAMLHLRMMLECIPVLMARVEDHVGQPVPGLPTRERGPVMQLIVDLVDQSIHEGELDAGDGLPAAAMVALERSLERDAIPVKPRRATSRYQAAPSGLAPMLRDCIPWEWLIPTRARSLRMKELESPLRERAMERYGLGGDAPRTLEAVARDAGTTASSIERQIGRT